MPQSFPQRQVGKTSLSVPTFGLGTAHISTGGEAQAIAIVQAALENGINYIDTAPLYKSEPHIGKALAGVPRDSYIIATKIGRLPDGKGGFIFDFSRDGVMKSLENSLRDLQIDQVDILHIHDPDDHYPNALETAFPTLAELRSQGVVKAIGAGMNQWQMLVDFANNGDFDCFLLAGRYTLIEQTSLDALRLFHEKNISIFAGGVYNSGILATGATTNARYQYADAPEHIKEKVRKIEIVCTRHNIPLNAAAVQFVRAHPAITSLVVGADAVSQITENIEALNADIPAAFWDDIRAEDIIEEAAPTP